MIELKKLLMGVATPQIDKTVHRLQFDSRCVQANDVFVALKGTEVDGHSYIETAIQKGASVIVCQELPAQKHADIQYICVEDSSKALGLMAANFYKHPSKELKLIGVTGTNGKTSIATLLYELFIKLGFKVGLLSTVKNYIHTTPIDATHTTPDAIAIQSLLADMVEAGCDYAFMEVSSHAADQNRIAGLDFDGGIFTNLTRDHMDYHHSFDNYLAAKKKFFDALPKTAFALTNGDEKQGMVMLQNCKALKKTYGLRTLCDFHTQVLEDGFEGMLLTMNKHEISLPFIGRFNAYNLTAVFGTAVLLGFTQQEVLMHLSSLKAVAGRFETFRSPQGITAIVDYAHTPDALSNVLSTINEIQTGGEVFTVVGCGGNRDKGKRPLMAQEATRLSNKVFLTSDNPRNEDPNAILQDMTDGLDPVARRKTLVIADRKEAIKAAIMMAQENDVVLIAGKGHEDYQIIQGVKHHFDDREIVLEAFQL